MVYLKNCFKAFFWQCSFPCFSKFGLLIIQYSSINPFVATHRLKHYTSSESCIYSQDCKREFHTLLKISFHCSIESGKKNLITRLCPILDLFSISDISSIFKSLNTHVFYLSIWSNITHPAKAFSSKSQVKNFRWLLFFSWIFLRSC